MHDTRTGNSADHRLPVSVIFLTFNEGKNVERGLKSVADWAGEIFVVDSGSTNETLDIARRYTDNIVHHDFENYAQQRNWAQQHLPLAYDWVFHIDADEWVMPELRSALAEFFTSQQVNNTDGLLIKRRTEFLGRWIKHGGHYPSYHLRIFRHEKGRCETRKYDQHYVVRGNLHRLERGDLVDPVTTDLDSWTMRHVRWASLEAEELASRQQRPTDGTQVVPRAWGNMIERRRWARLSVYYRMPLFLRATAYFFVRYVIRLGFLDGYAGLIFHVLQGFWFRFYIDAKVWENQHAPKPDA